MEARPADLCRYQGPQRHLLLLDPNETLATASVAIHRPRGPLGLAFLGFSEEKSLIAATLFADFLTHTLVEAGLDLQEITWQTDNGSEFIGSWNAKTPSAFTENIEGKWKATHRRILPAPKLTKPMSKPFIGSSSTKSLI